MIAAGIEVSTLREKNQSNYPADALRELILNACMHRDYQAHMPTRFYQFVDRIEIMNPGGLYGKARPENFPEVNDYRNPIIAQALKIMGYVNMFNRGVSRVKNMMVENGGVEPTFNVDKITAFEVISYSAIKPAELQNAALDFPKLFQEKDKDVINAILNALTEPKSAKELASIVSCSVRTIKDKYLDKMLQAEVIDMTVPDKPTSRNQKYRLLYEKNNPTA